MPSDIQAQIERRRQRAKEEIARVSNKGNHPIFSSFEVKSASGQVYRVDIQSLDELQNTCTCPDYQTNLIGTCKHIEGVLLHLRREYGDRLAAMSRQRPRGTRIYLHYGLEVTVRVGLPLPRRSSVGDLLARTFDPDGLLVGSPGESLPALLAALDHLSPQERALVRVDDAVRRQLDLLRDREEVQRQRAWFAGQVQRGNRTLDVLSARLYPYQESGALHLAFGRRTLLADDMGLGKTVQAIAASALLRELRGIQRALIICPASLKHQWEREIHRFTSLPANVVEGGLKERRSRYADAAFFTIVNYELVRHDLDELLKLRPDLIILDEAQRIKNWRTKTAAMVKQLRSPYAFVLTGTPLENRIDELYSIFQFLDPRILGPLWHFNDRFYELEQRASGSVKVLGYKNLDALRGLIDPYVLRRTRAGSAARSAAARGQHLLRGDDRAAVEGLRTVPRDGGPAGRQGAAAAAHPQGTRNPADVPGQDAPHLQRPGAARSGHPGQGYREDQPQAARAGPDSGRRDRQQRAQGHPVQPVGGHAGPRPSPSSAAPAWATSNSPATSRPASAAP